jgi:hypothetical protein
VDANANGVLDDAEIDSASTQTVCNGQGPGATASGDLTGDYPAPSIAPLAVTTGKLADGAVTGDKLSLVGALAGQALVFDGSSVGWGKPSLFASTIWISPTGDQSADGAALISAITTAGATATSAQRVLVRLEPGTYDLGTTRITVPANVDLQGSGEGSIILGTGQGDQAGSSLVTVGNDSSVRDLSLTCTAGSTYCTGLSIASGRTNLIEDVHISVSATNPIALSISDTQNFRLRDLYLSIDAPAGDGTGLAVSSGFGEADNLKIDGTGSGGNTRNVNLASGAILRMHGGVLWAQSQNSTAINVDSSLLYAESLMIQNIANANSTGVSFTSAGESAVISSHVSVNGSAQGIGILEQQSSGTVLIGDVISATGNIAQGVLLSGGTVDLQGLNANAMGSSSGFGVQATGSGAFTVRQSVLRGSSFGAYNVGGATLRIAGTEVSGSSGATSGVTACPASWNGSTLAPLNASCI